MIHVNETLIVASKSIKGIEQQHLDFITKQSYGECRWNRTQNRFRFQLDLLQSLLSRSESNRARLQNEITLVRYPSISFPVASTLTSLGVQCGGATGQQGTGPNRTGS